MAFPNPDFSEVKSLFSYASTVTDGYFGVVATILIFAVLLINQIGYGARRAFMVSSFVTSVASVFLSLLGVLSASAPAVPIILFAVSVFFVKEGV